MPLLRPHATGCAALQPVIGISAVAPMCTCGAEVALTRADKSFLISLAVLALSSFSAYTFREAAKSLLDE